MFARLKQKANNVNGRGCMSTLHNGVGFILHQSMVDVTQNRPIIVGVIGTLEDVDMKVAMNLVGE